MLFSLTLILSCFLISFCRADVSEWTTAIKSGDREGLEKELQTLTNLLREALDADSKLADVVDPLDAIFNDYAIEGATPDPQELKGLIKSLPSARDDVNAIRPVEDALQWLKDREVDAVSPISTQGRIRLDRLRCLVEQQAADIHGVHNGISEIVLIAEASDKAGQEVEVGRLATIFYQNAGRWRGRKQDRDDQPLKDFEVQVRYFATEWDLKRE